MKGGARPGSGRKPKADEIRVAESMDKALDLTDVFEALKALVLTGDVQAIKLWLSYRLGMPKQGVDITSGGEKVQMPVINIIRPDE